MLVANLGAVNVYFERFVKLLGTCHPILQFCFRSSVLRELGILSYSNAGATANSVATSATRLYTEPFRALAIQSHFRSQFPVA